MLLAGTGRGRTGGKRLLQLLLLKELLLLDQLLLSDLRVRSDFRSLAIEDDF